MNKKGAELSMNVIIITILVVIVLVIMAVFFTGGMASLTNRISSIFTGQLTDISDAEARCNAYCLKYENAGTEFIKNEMRTNFCRKEIDVDLNVNGNYEESEKDKNCADLGFSCEITC